MEWDDGEEEDKEEEEYHQSACMIRKGPACFELLVSCESRAVMPARAIGRKHSKTIKASQGLDVGPR